MNSQMVIPLYYVKVVALENIAVLIAEDLVKKIY